jgi:hypothetical protein
MNFSTYIGRNMFTVSGKRGSGRKSFRCSVCINGGYRNWKIAVCQHLHTNVDSNG